MGTTSEKLTYLNNTKQLLKDKINNLGGSIDDNTTFRQYANQLQNVYDNLPKTEYQEGTEVNLGVTSKGKLDYENGVVVIGQSEQESTTGKNKLDSSTIQQTTRAGITITYDSSTQEITINGTCTTNNTSFPFSNTSYEITKNVTTLSIYYVSGNITNVTGTNCIRCASSGYGAFANVNFDSIVQDKTISNTSTYNTFTAVNNFIRTDKDTTFNNLKFRIMLADSTDTTYEKYTGGQASPNPIYKQEIKCVAGRNKLPTHEIKKFTASADAWCSLDGISNFYNQTNIAPSKVFCNLKANQTYTISVYQKANTNNVQLVDYTGTVLLTGLETQAKQYTPSTDIKVYPRLKVTSSNTETYCYMQIEEGTQATPYLPYNTIEEVVSGENKFNLKGWINTLANQSSPIGSGTLDSYTDNSITITSTGNDCYTRSFTMGTASANKELYLNNPDFFIEIEPSTEYTLSFVRSNSSIPARPMLFYLDKDFNYLSLVDPGALLIDKITNTTPNNAKYLTMRIGMINSSGQTLTISNIMYVKGTSTSYIPYVAPKNYQLSLGDIELNAIGNYKDYIYKDLTSGKWYKKENVGKYTFTGNEGISLNQNMNYVFQFVINNVIQGIGDYIPRSKCNMFSYKYGNPTNETNENYFWIYNLVSPVIVIQKTIVSDLATFKTWLANNKPQLYYLKATANDIEITDTTLINQLNAWYNAHSNNGTTIITSNGNLPMIIKVRGLKGE